MRRSHLVPVAVALLVTLMLAACAPAATEPPPTNRPAPTAAPTELPQPTPVPTVDFENALADFDSSKFDNPTVIDNPWLPLVPGMQYIYEGVTEEAGLTTPHRVIITATDLTKVIHGVRSIVMWDRDYSAGDLVETELAFFAQDNEGNVWRMGEYPEVYEGGKFIEAPAWISGIKGARAGIFMPANPTLGAPSFSQGWGPAVNFTDRAQVSDLSTETCVPLDCFTDVLVMGEFSREEPDAFQLKYYVSGIGNVRVGWEGLDATKEVLELVEIIQLTPEEMAEVRAQALELEARAYEISQEVYDQTSPAESS